MTVSASYAPLEYPGDGSTVAFPVTWPFGEASDLLVTAVSADAETVKSLTTHYTVTQTASGGTVTALTAPASGVTWRIERATPKTQPDQLRNGGAYSGVTVEAMHDRTVRQVQELAEVSDRSLRIPVADAFDAELPSPVAGAVPVVNEAKTGFSWALWGENAAALVNLALSTGAALVGFIANGVGAVVRTVQDKLRDYVPITDFGGVGDGVTDNSPALTLAIAHAIATGKGVEYPPGVFEHATGATMSTLVPIKGAGVGRTWLKCDDTVFITYANAVKATYADLGSGFRFTGPGAATADSACFYFNSTSAGSSFCNWRDIQVGSVESFWLSDAPPADAGTATNRFAGAVNWSTFDNISLRGGIKYGARFRKGSGTGNCWVGGKPGIDQAGGAVVECLGAPAADNDMEGINVGDFFFLGVHALTEQAVSADAVFFRGGPDTTYRSRIGFFGCQFDAEQDIPIDLSTTGSVAWSNIRLGADNSIGGAVNIYDHTPALARSIVDDQGVSVHRSQFNTTRTTGASPASYTDDIFKVALGTGSGARVDIDATGTMGSYGSFAGHWSFSVRRGADTPTVEEISEWVNGDVLIALNVTTTAAADGTVLFTLAFTTGATPGNTTVDCQLQATGGTLKVQNGRHL